MELLEMLLIPESFPPPPYLAAAMEDTAVEETEVSGAAEFESICLLLVVFSQSISKSALYPFPIYLFLEKGEKKLISKSSPCLFPIFPHLANHHHLRANIRAAWERASGVSPSPRGLLLPVRRLLLPTTLPFHSHQDPQTTNTTCKRRRRERVRGSRKRSCEKKRCKKKWVHNSDIWQVKNAKLLEMISFFSSILFQELVNTMVWGTKNAKLLEMLQMHTATQASKQAAHIYSSKDMIHACCGNI